MSSSIEGFRPRGAPSAPSASHHQPPNQTAASAGANALAASPAASRSANPQPSVLPSASGGAAASGASVVGGSANVPAASGSSPVSPSTNSASPAASKSFRGVVVGRRRQHRLDVVLVRGGIENVDARAVVLGVYRNVEPKGPAARFDQLLGGAITEFVDRRMFAAAAGDIFILPTGTHPVRAEFVVFAGLGEFQKFDDETQILVSTNVIRSLLHAGIGEFATLMFGGGSGRDVRHSARNLIQGFVQGLVEADKRHDFRRVILCEFDEDRYAELKEELYHLASTPMFDEVEVTLDEIVPCLTYAASAFPDQLVKRHERQPTYLTVRQYESPSNPSQYTFESAVLTVGSKATVVQSVRSYDKRQIDELLASLRHAGRLDLDDFSARLFGLVFDASITSLWENDAELRNSHLVVAHDYEASRIPWEALRLGGVQPAVVAGLTRNYVAANLSIAKWLEQRRYGATLDVLLVVDPTQDLPGAAREGQLVLQELQRIPTVRIVNVEGREATKERLLREFSSGQYDVIHYAGHAYFDAVQRGRSGILCAGEEVLSGDDLANLSRLPGLVFFNACESGRLRGASDDVRELTQQSVGFAESFLRGGVANFVGTYWPVADEPASVFAREFYRRVVDGQTLGDAVLESRIEVKKLNVNDWADYMFYGSPGFVLKTRIGAG